MGFDDLRKEALKLLREASAGDGQNCGPVVGVLGRVLEDMDRKGQEWNALIQQARTPRQGNGHYDAASHSSELDFTGKDIQAVVILGKRIPVGNYKEGLFTVVQELQKQHPNFDDVALRVKGSGPYFSTKREDLRDPEKLKQGKLFIETNQDSNRKWKICQGLVRYLGYNPQDPSVLSFEVEPTRTRHRNRRSKVIDANDLT